MNDNSPRPRPILVTQAILAAVGVVITSAGFAEQIPASAAWWFLTGYLAINAGLAFYLQSITTPLSSPKDSQGRDLVPAEAPIDGAGLAWTQPDPNTPVVPRPDL